MHSRSFSVFCKVVSALFFKGINFKFLLKIMEKLVYNAIGQFYPQRALFKVSPSFISTKTNFRFFYILLHPLNLCSNAFTKMIQNGVVSAKL